MADSCGCLYDFCSAVNLETHPRGGGYGDPFERNPESVRNDVVQQLISIEKAK